MPVLAPQKASFAYSATSSSSAVFCPLLTVVGQGQGTEESVTETGPVLATSHCFLCERLFLVGVNQLQEPPQPLHSHVQWAEELGLHRAGSGTCQGPRQRSEHMGIHGGYLRHVEATVGPSVWLSGLLPQLHCPLFHSLPMSLSNAWPSPVGPSRAGVLIKHICIQSRITFGGWACDSVVESA